MANAFKRMTLLLLPISFLSLCLPLTLLLSLFSSLFLFIYGSLITFIIAAFSPACTTAQRSDCTFKAIQDMPIWKQVVWMCHLGPMDHSVNICTGIFSFLRVSVCCYM